MITAEEVHAAFIRAFPTELPPFMTLTTAERHGFESMAVALSRVAAIKHEDEQKAYDEGWAACERDIDNRMIEGTAEFARKEKALRKLQAEVEQSIGNALDSEVAKLEAAL